LAELARLFLQTVANLKKKRKPILQHRRSIGGAIRTHRKSAGLTQEKLAELVDLNPKYVGEVERGEKIISIEALLRIARTLKIPVHKFLQDIDNP
jgi:transcriptional regulator with XRE-family HTH domain